MLGLEVEDDFFTVLYDGVILCSIINTIKPGTIPKVRLLVASVISCAIIVFPPSPPRIIF
jgi:hypothetical protein